MPKVLLTITESNCRSGLHRAGEVYEVGDVCPPICHELWYCAYPFIYALQNGGTLDCGEEKDAYFEVKCPDGGRVVLQGRCIK